MFVRSLVIFAVLSLTTPWGVSAAPRGAAELSVDRAVVAQWLARALTEPIHTEGPAGVEVEIRLSGPTRLRFAKGGIEARVEISLPALGWRGHVQARYEVRVERLEGTVLFVPVDARLEPALPLPGDLASLLPEVPLPRSIAGDLELADGVRIPLRAFVQGAHIDDERLHLQLGLDLR